MVRGQPGLLHSRSAAQSAPAPQIRAPKFDASNAGRSSIAIIIVLPDVVNCCSLQSGSIVAENIDAGGLQQAIETLQRDESRLFIHRLFFRPGGES
jgi:hypothetical protein